MNGEFQTVFSTKKYKYEEHGWFKEDIIVMKANLTSLFGFDYNHTMYIYELNFSMN